jgi:ABC-type branched-subunit amino acid transport system permease subunit
MAIMFGQGGQAHAPRPHVGLFDATTAKGFYYVAVAVVVVSVAAIAALGRSRLGRLLRGLADSPVALATLGNSVNLTLVIVFCVSAFFAGVAGALFASFSGTFGSASFPSLLSLTLVVILAIAGRGEFASPIIAAAALYIVPSYVRNATFNDYLPVFFGASAVAVAVVGNPRLDVPGRIAAAAARATRSDATTRARVRADRLVRGTST